MHVLSLFSCPGSAFGWNQPLLRLLLLLPITEEEQEQDPEQEEAGALGYGSRITLAVRPAANSSNASCASVSE